MLPSLLQITRKQITRCSLTLWCSPCRALQMTIQCWDNDYKTWPHPATNMYIHMRLMSELHNRQTVRESDTQKESDSQIISQTDSPILYQKVRDTVRQTDTDTDKALDCCKGAHCYLLFTKILMSQSLTCIWPSSSLKSLFLSSSSKSMMSNTDSTPYNNDKTALLKLLWLLMCEWNTIIIVTSLHVKAIGQYFHVVLILYKRHRM